jgi:hypothetical protein
MSTISLPPEGRLGYKEAKELARHPDAGLRLSLAGRRDVPPEILYYLADDPDPDVRRAIVANQSTPALAHLVLVDDMDEGVRAGLAERIVRLAPGLNADERDRARQTAYRVLERLAEDQIPRVRQILSEALKDVADAPADVINRLARDVEEAVSAPVLEFSPVLRDEDLLDIIGENPTTATLSAISRRARVGADVADAIAATEDSNAIAVLLANASAQIREETLDHLIELAEAHPAWHEPLVKRPELRHDAAVRLAHFVADRLIQALIERQDLSEETLREVRRVVHRRLEDEGASTVPMQRNPADGGPEAGGWMNGLITAYERALRLADSGLLDENAVVQGIKAGDSSFVIAALAAKGGLSPAVVQAAVQSASGRAIAAVVWKAGLSPAVSVHVQIHLAGIPPGDVVGGIEGTGFGLTDSEMEWQIEMFGQIAAEEAS